MYYTDLYVKAAVEKQKGSNAFDNMITVGRAGNNDIALEISSISKFHAYVSFAKLHRRATDNSQVPKTGAFDRILPSQALVGFGGLTHCFLALQPERRFLKQGDHSGVAASRETGGRNKRPPARTR